MTSGVSSSWYCARCQVGHLVPLMQRKRACASTSEQVVPPIRNMHEATKHRGTFARLFCPYTDMFTRAYAVTVKGTKSHQIMCSQVLHFAAFENDSLLALPCSCEQDEQNLQTKITRHGWSPIYPLTCSEFCKLSVPSMQ